MDVNNFLIAQRENEETRISQSGKLEIEKPMDLQSEFIKLYEQCLTTKKVRDFFKKSVSEINNVFDL